MYDTTKPYNQKIRELIRQTWDTPYLTVREHGIYKEKFSSEFEKYQHPDGIGTKGVYQWHKRNFSDAAIDALAMNLNDLALHRAIPYIVTDHIMIPEDDTFAILEIVESLCKECKKRDIAILHGETAIHNNIDGLEISINATGFIKNPKPNRFEIGDVLVGFRSSGLHSNGFTKIREIFGQSYLELKFYPTKIYSDKILKLDEQFDIHGLAHITGGAFTKIKQCLPDNADIEIKRDTILKPQEIFREIYKKGVSDNEMYKTFNCGIGFVISLDIKDAKKLLLDMEAEIIGEVIPGRRKIKIESNFSDVQVEY